ncbi:MAG: ABC transporter permease [Calditrichaceae bacterium]
MNQESLILPEYLTFDNAEQIFRKAKEMLTGKKAADSLSIDFSSVTRIDSAGGIAIDRISTMAEKDHKKVELINVPDEINQSLILFRRKHSEEPPDPPRKGMFESTGGFVYDLLKTSKDFILLLANITYWGLVSLFRTKLRRKGEVIRQSISIGVNALPIISLIAFLIGFITALQSAAQLRQFGANIFVADLVAIAMVSEMGPLITAIMVAGRSGSAIAAEIATMQVTEEIDALKAMGIDPIPYLIVPKVIAITLTLPMLTMFANFIGIFGGAVIGMTYLDIDLIPFYNEVLTVLRYKEIMTSLVKSIIFALIIVITGTHFGLEVKGGSEGVGRSTTASVVMSIFLVIVADSILGLLFYFE